MNCINSEKGQTIVEAIVALAAIFVIVAAIAIAIISAVSNSQFIKSQNLANKYAQQAMEFIRGMHADNINEFQVLSGAYSFGENDIALIPGESLTVNIGDTHIRNIFFADDEEPCLNDDGSSINLKKVTVVVNWSSGKCASGDTFCHDTTIVSCIPYERNAGVFP